jgi:hypothetical protein
MPNKRKSTPAQRPVYEVAPTVTERTRPGEWLASSWPSEPPKPLRRTPKLPVFRPLKVYAFGPSLGRAPGNIRSINVRYEKLAPGPIGERIAVIDYDASRDCFYDPVNLDDPLIAINGGLDPSESDPQFHQQMVYAVASETLRRVEVALGRTVHRRSAQGATPLRLTIYPHGDVIQNSYAAEGRIAFGYFRAESTATGRTVPGQTIFSCLSHDIIAQVTASAILGAMRPDLVNSDAIDNQAFAVTMADLTALLFHFTHREVVLDTIRRTAGIIYRSQLETDSVPGSDGPRIVAELAANNPLLALSQDFGDAVGLSGGLRTALAAPDPAALERTTDPFARGTIVVAAVFDALFSIYQRRTLDLFRIHRAGGGAISGNDVPEPLAERLYDEISRLAVRMFNMCWRALDYCPARQVALGDVLRACITADYEYAPEDAAGVRDALMQAFRLRGIKPPDASFFSEDTLRWPLADASGWKRTQLDVKALDDDGGRADLRRFVEQNAGALGFKTREKPVVFPLDTSRLTAPDDTPKITRSTQVLTEASGVTLVFESGGRLRYAIPASTIEAAPPTAPRRRKRKAR